MALSALNAPTVAGELFERLSDGRLRCLACAQACALADGAAGICQTRWNSAGVLRVPHGYVAGLQVDPIEKKPFYHALPGTGALSFGMLGCNFHCAFCQNWLSSQAPRRPGARLDIEEITPDEIVRTALARGARAVISTYNEPWITAEWARDVFRVARAAGLATGMVSNGFATPQALDLLRPCMDLLKIDLKSFSDERYRELGGRLQPVLDTIRGAIARGYWVEVVTLVVPGFNDTAAELARMAEFLSGVSRDLPWHVTAFHPDYEMRDRPATSVDQLRRAVDAGRAAGLRYVYAGNLAGRDAGLEDTACPNCSTPLIERSGFRVTRNALGADGRCPLCATRVAGFWSVGR
jgi:pyruvate formate lyase activating enzyme